MLTRINMNKSFRRSISWVLAVLMVVPLFWWIGTANAAATQLTNRKVTLSSSAVSPATSSYTFQYTQADTDTLGSVKFLFCTAPSGTCTTPTGLVTTSATFGSYTGDSGTWTLNNTTNGAPFVTRTAAAGTAGTKTIVINNITNPSSPPGTFYVRITTYSGTDGSTGPDDTGTVAASTANQITLTGSVEETLTFCVGITVATNCSSTTGTDVTFSASSIFSPTATRSGTSQFSAATNAQGGYIVTVNGSTLTSGANTISALSSPTASTTGTEQFGMNLKDNASPDVGAEVVQLSGDSDAVAQTGYNTADQYKFVTGDTVAGGANSSDFSKFTASYIVNISGVTEAGTYTTTLTYICTATF